MTYITNANNLHEKAKMQRCVDHVNSEKEDVWAVVSAKDDKTNELYVNLGDGFTGRGGLVPWGCSETK